MRATGQNVFIGHGHSLVWLELKNFLQDDLHMTIDEFNRVSTAGVATSNRLEQMLDDAAFAFLILTAEDESTDGKFHARENGGPDQSPGVLCRSNCILGYQGVRSVPKPQRQHGT